MGSTPTPGTKEVMTNNPIGILDSGVGGLTVLKAITAELPHESFIYLGDSANTPYGAKSEEEICARSKRLVDFLMSKNVKLIVVACNTITVSCLDQLRKDYPEMPFIGTVPVIKTAAAVTKNVIEAGVLIVVESTEVTVLATVSTHDPGESRPAR